jgi:hypothetical protein
MRLLADGGLTPALKQLLWGTRIDWYRRMTNPSCDTLQSSGDGSFGGVTLTRR